MTVNIKVMDKQKIEKLSRHGWKTGSTADFLGLSAGESAYIEIKVALAEYIQKKRKKKHLTQVQLARLLHSSQSRVAKMEKNDPTVSVDLMLKSLFALGTSKNELVQAIG